MRFKKLAAAKLKPGDKVPGCGTVEWVEVHPDEIQVDWVEPTKWRSPTARLIRDQFFQDVVRP